MKTKLPTKITSVKQAKTFLTDLFNNGESYHPEDDANDIIKPNGKPLCTWKDAKQLNKLRDDMYQLKNFDPCAIFCDLLHVN